MDKVVGWGHGLDIVLPSGHVQLSVPFVVEE
jgi:hypothetical protein